MKSRETYSTQGQRDNHQPILRLLRFWGRCFGLGRRDGAEHVAADIAVLPRAGILVAINHRVGTKRAQAGNGDVVQIDHRLVARPLDLQRHRQGDVLFAVLDARGENSNRLAHFLHRMNGVRLLDRRYFLANEGKLSSHLGIGQRFQTV